MKDVTAPTTLCYRPQWFNVHTAEVKDVTAPTTLCYRPQWFNVHTAEVKDVTARCVTDPSGSMCTRLR